jgi:hypothetical protein
MPVNTHMIRVTDASYRLLREQSLKYQLDLRRQVSMAEIVAAALHIAMKHPTEIDAEMTDGE